MRNPTRFMATCIAAIAATTGSLSAEVGVTADSVVSGQAAALKGPAEGLGTGMQTGLSVYFDKVNAAGGVKGRKIELKSLNDGYEPDRTAEVTKMLVEKVKVFALIGGVSTPTSKAAVPIAEAAQTLTSLPSRARSSSAIRTTAMSSMCAAAISKRWKHSPSCWWTSGA